MDCIDAIRARRSCRNFSTKQVEREKILNLIESATYAPSPANKQPWEFVVVANKPIYNQAVKEAAEKAVLKAAERSGWKWLSSFKIDFLTQAPVLILVVGDPSRNGAEQFLDEPSQGYEHACSAAIQNMMLAAQSEGLATLWYSLYEKDDLRKIFNISTDKDPLALICVGYTEQNMVVPPRKAMEEKITFI